MSRLVISLDFELFWGVVDSHTIAGYGKNVEGEWEAIPRMLALLQRYDVRATWATVGMLMCRNYAQWREIRPAVLPGYTHPKRSTYSHGDLVREYPKLFFGRPLLERILATPGQEVATHTYSHFYCSEQGATSEQFSADLACAQAVASDMGLRYRSIVFPRNQVVEAFIPTLAGTGIQTYRGNPDHWLYRNGNAVPGGLAGRAVRLADAWLPLSGKRVAYAKKDGGLVNVPASLFLYPWFGKLNLLEHLRLARLKKCMTEAARSDGICHLWWHPHNFGVHKEKNLALLELLLRHYAELRDRYGMLSASMGDLATKEGA